MHSTTLTAGSITLSSGNVKTAGNQVITGSNARAQATVDQRGSVVRLGSNTSAQVGDRGDVSLSKGVVLISSGEGFLRRPAVQVATPQGDVTVRGSAIVAVLPDGSVKMTCLEGSVRGDLGGQNTALNPGHLIVQRPEGTRDTVQVNLNTLTHSSALLDNASFKQPLPAAPEIRQEVAQQAQSFGATTMAIARSDGAGTPKITLGNATELKTAEVKSAAPGLITRIFGGGTSGGQTDGNSHAAGTTVQVQGANSSQAPTANVISASQVNSLRISGEVSGSNVFLANTGTAGGMSTPVSITQGSEGQLQRTLAVTPIASASLVLANGSTQQMVSQGSLTLASNVNAMSGVSVVRGGSATLTLSNAQNLQAIGTVGSGTLSITSGGTLTPTGSGGVLIFQPTNVGNAAPAGAP